MLLFIFCLYSAGDILSTTLRSRNSVCAVNYIRRSVGVLVSVSKRESPNLKGKGLLVIWWGNVNCRFALFSRSCSTILVVFLGFHPGQPG